MRKKESSDGGNESMMSKEEHVDLAGFHTTEQAFNINPNSELLSKRAVSFWKDVVKNLNISDRHVELSRAMFGRVQIGTLCYQKKLHWVLVEEEVEKWDNNKVELVKVRVTVEAEPKEGYLAKTSFQRTKQTKFDLKSETVRLKLKSTMLKDNIVVKKTFDVSELKQKYADSKRMKVVDIKDLRVQDHKGEKNTIALHELKDMAV